MMQQRRVLRLLPSEKLFECDKTLKSEEPSSDIAKVTMACFAESQVATSLNQLVLSLPMSLLLSLQQVWSQVKVHLGQTFMFFL